MWTNSINGALAVTPSLHASNYCGCNVSTTSTCALQLFLYLDTKKSSVHPSVAHRQLDTRCTLAEWYDSKPRCAQLRFRGKIYKKTKSICKDIANLCKQSQHMKQALLWNSNMVCELIYVWSYVAFSLLFFTIRQPNYGP